MRNFGKIVSVVLLFTIIFSTVVFAADNKAYADELYELGLFKGTEKGYELDRTLTREEAVTIFVRLLGEEENSEKQNYSEVFSDVASDRWSFPYVMYCYENEITKGTGVDLFSPETPISAEEFVTLVFRLLGYTEIEPENALEESIYLNLLNSEVVRNLTAAEKFTRDDMVYVVYRSLMAEMADGRILADFLAVKSVISNEQAEKFNAYKSTDNIDELLEKLLD